tara:strand:- start:3073 stop:3177 length:105 start_codon:yes stop_codon:yes gene_type:complete
MIFVRQLLRKENQGENKDGGNIDWQYLLRMADSF